LAQALGSSCHLTLSTHLVVMGCQGSTVSRCVSEGGKLENIDVKSECGSPEFELQLPKLLDSPTSRRSPESCSGPPMIAVKSENFQESVFSRGSRECQWPYRSESISECGKVSNSSTSRSSPESCSDPPMFAVKSENSQESEFSRRSRECPWPYRSESISECRTVSRSRTSRSSPESCSDPPVFSVRSEKSQESEFATRSRECPWPYCSAGRSECSTRSSTKQFLDRQRSSNRSVSPSSVQCHTSAQSEPSYSIWSPSITKRGGQTSTSMSVDDNEFEFEDTSWMGPNMLKLENSRKDYMVAMSI